MVIEFSVNYSRAEIRPKQYRMETNGRVVNATLDIRGNDPERTEVGLVRAAKPLAAIVLLPLRREAVGGRSMQKAGHQLSATIRSLLPKRMACVSAIVWMFTSPERILRYLVT